MEQNQNSSQNLATTATHRGTSYRKTQKEVLGDLLGRDLPRAGVSDALAAEV